jgi:hypothetical protein
MKKLIHALLYAVALQSCSMLPHSSLPLSIAPIDKPVYDSIVKVSLPVHAGIGASEWSNVFGNTSLDQNSMYLWNAEGGIAASAKWFSTGFTGFYYSGKLSKESDVAQYAQEYRNGAAFSGYGLRFNASLDHQFKRKGRYLTWRYFAVQSNVAYEDGAYSDLRHSVSRDLKNDDLHRYFNPSTSASLAMQYYTSLSYRKDHFQFSTSLGFVNIYDINDQSNPFVSLFGPRTSKDALLSYRDAFFSATGGWKNFYLSISFMYSLPGMSLASSNTMMYQVSGLANLGYRITLK